MIKRGALTPRARSARRHGRRPGVTAGCIWAASAGGAAWRWPWTPRARRPGGRHASTGV